MNKQERIEFVEKCLRLSLAISERSEGEFHCISIYKDGEINVNFGYYGEYNVSCIELSDEDLNCNIDELVAKREAEKQQRIKACKEAEEKNLIEFLARAAETEYKRYLELKAKFENPS